MRRAIAIALLAGGCSSVHSALHAERGASYEVTTTVAARCVIRDEDGFLSGDERTLELSTRDGNPLAAVDDVAAWGRAKSASGVDYTYGQLCRAPRECADLLYFDDGKVRVWIEVETIRPAGGETIFEAQLEEGRLITKAAHLFKDARQIAAFDDISRSFEAATSARGSMLSLLPLMETINDVRTAANESSAAIGTQLSLPTLGQLLNEHSVFLYDQVEEELRVFEVVRAICATPVAARRPT